MENKLQELTKKLYDEGLAKGRSEAERLLAEAHADARRIVEEALKESERIMAETEIRANELRRNTTSELNLAGSRMIAKLKHHIRELIVTRAIGDAPRTAAIDPTFVKEALLAVCRNWNGAGAGAVALAAVLPESMRDQLDEALTKSIEGVLDSEVEITWSDVIKSGFRVGPKDGGYYISFTDADFDALFGDYLRPKVSGIVFGTVDN